jgi:hypothetical protein
MRWRRTPREIAFRLRQEVRNLALLAHPPRLGKRLPMPSTPLTGMPDASEFAEPLSDTALQDLAAQIREHRFPILGLTIETGPDIAWRRDYTRAKETGTDYFRLIPFLDVERAGDHKIIWELNRHQHLVVLAQAGELEEIVSQLKSWFRENPFQRGINWASALEVAFRALSWIWVYHLIGDRFPASFRKEFLQQLYWHGWHIENNLSFYFSPNTHLLGEAVALHALGFLFPQFPHARLWRELGLRVVRQQMDRQVHGDGSHFEQSTYYHVYALDMFRFTAVLELQSPAYLQKLAGMVEFRDAVMGPQRRLPFFGDDDGGRFFQPYGRRDEFGRNGPPPATRLRSRLFPDIGIAVMVAGPVHIVIDAGPFGPWSSGHSHSDTLSLIVRVGDEEVLIDPGTYTYAGDPAERDWFRGSAAHNTIRIDGQDQAILAGPFGWKDQPRVKIHSWSSTADEDTLGAECCYAGFTHRRRFLFQKSEATLKVIDEITGPAGEHEIEQFWHLGSGSARARIALPETFEQIESWASSAYGEKHRIPALRLVRRGPLPMRLEASINLQVRAALPAS